MKFDVTDSNFESEVLKSELPVLVDFWTSWCGPCKAISPIIDEIAKKYQGSLKVVKMNVDENPRYPEIYNVRGIPTLLFFKRRELVDQIVGYSDNNDIEKIIKKLL
jgi:thioredoxin 1